MRWKERSEQTARREGKEETGLDVRIGEFVGCYTTPSTDFSRMSTITIVHRAEIIGGELRSSIEGRPYWVDEATLRSRLEEHYHIILNNYLHSEKVV
jgi:ADP-ribose pyrophosphatase YjhB (NUDIX family)